VTVKFNGGVRVNFAGLTGTSRWIDINASYSFSLIGDGDPAECASDMDNSYGSVGTLITGSLPVAADGSVSGAFRISDEANVYLKNIGFLAAKDLEGAFNIYFDQFNAKTVLGEDTLGTGGRLTIDNCFLCGRVCNISTIEQNEVENAGFRTPSWPIVTIRNSTFMTLGYDVGELGAKGGFLSPIFIGGQLTGGVEAAGPRGQDSYSGRWLIENTTFWNRVDPEGKTEYLPTEPSIISTYTDNTGTGTEARFTFSNCFFYTGSPLYSHVWYDYGTNASLENFYDLVASSVTDLDPAVNIIDSAGVKMTKTTPSLNIFGNTGVQNPNRLFFRKSI
jgi:hypothetical protein